MFAGFSEDGDWDFCVTGGESPTIFSQSPRPFSESFLPGSNVLYISFDQRVKKFAGSINIYDSSDPSSPVISVPTSSNTVLVEDVIVGGSEGSTVTFNMPRYLQDRVYTRTSILRLDHSGLFSRDPKR